MSSHRAARPPRRPVAEAAPPTTLGASALGADARARLVELARRHGLAPAAAGHAVDHAEAAAAREPWTTAEAAARRALLDALRQDPTAGRPELGDARRLTGALPPGAVTTDDDADWDGVPEGERAVFAGAVFDGLDLIGLARALGTHRLDVKARARRVLSRLAGAEATGSGLAAVRHMMAGEYALGLVPPDASAPFQRGLALDPGLQALVAAWDARLAPFHDATALSAAAGAPRAAAERAPTPTVGAPGRAGGGRRAIAGAIAVVAVLAVGVAGWIANTGTPGAGVPAFDSLPAPRRAPAVLAAEAAASVPVVTAGTEAAAAPARPRPLTPPPAWAGAATPASSVAGADRATALPAREVTASIDVHLHYRGADADLTARAGEIAELVRGLGATVELFDAGGLVVNADRLRFFFAGDAAAAEVLVEALPATTLQDFTHYTPTPAPGTLELWLASEPSR